MLLLSPQTVAPEAPGFSRPRCYFQVLWNFLRFVFGTTGSQARHAGAQQQCRCEKVVCGTDGGWCEQEKSRIQHNPIKAWLSHSKAFNTVSVSVFMHIYTTQDSHIYVYIHVAHSCRTP
jgi:hypothetical protein